jgi:hypothetical protein
LENTTYAWQVRAVVRDGFEELNIFENNGYSEIRSFSLQPACHAPTGLSAEQQGFYMRISWTPSDRKAVQVVAYRCNEKGFDWHTIKGNIDYANVFDIAPGKEFQYKVGTVCVDGTIVYSETRSFFFKDPRKDIMENCGVEKEILIDETTRLDELFIGDVFTANDFPVTVTKVSGQNGTFSGAGWIQYPVFLNANFAVTFNNIQLNADRQLINGAVKTTYDRSESQIGNMDREYKPGSSGPTLAWDLEISAVIPEGGNITYDPETGTLIITDANGTAVGNITLPNDVVDKFNGDEPFTYIVKDGNGDVYTIRKDEEGNIGTEIIDEVTVSDPAAQTLSFKINDILYTHNQTYTTMYNNNLLRIELHSVNETDTILWDNLDISVKKKKLVGSDTYAITLQKDSIQIDNKNVVTRFVQITLNTSNLNASNELIVKK